MHIHVSKLPSKTIQGSTLALQSIDNVHGSDGLPLGMLSVGDCVSDDVLQKDLENTTSLFVDQARDSLYTTSPSKATDGWLGDTLDVVS